MHNTARTPFNATWTGGLSDMLASRVFDVAPGGKELLVTRGAYCFESNPLNTMYTFPSGVTLVLPTR